MKYQELVDVYSALEATTKRLEKTEIIAEYLKKLDSDTIEKVGLLILGVVFPAWSSEEIGIGGKLVERAVAEAVGTSQASVEDAVRDGVYSLQGYKLDSLPSSGVVIVNGEKKFIK